jgi:hypothetical protein
VAHYPNHCRNFQTLVGGRVLGVYPASFQLCLTLVFTAQGWFFRKLWIGVWVSQIPTLSVLVSMVALLGLPGFPGHSQTAFRGRN